MSKIVRKKLFETAELLEQAAGQLGGLAAGGRTGDGIALLADCQDVAIALGTHIEKLRGVGTDTVLGLEDYCEKLYLAGESLQEGGARATDALRALNESLRAVRAALEKDFPDKKEIVFLPYKASMWDSLESVWMAARDDPDCEAYVIPIPYYTLDEQHRFQEFHYEGDQYPDDVPVTDYRSYDLQLHHPDAIYVHNPYDEFNNVTSVAPEFYLKKIKDYTEKLVYIPYFVLQEIDPSDQTAIDHMRQFCYLPGTWYADQVILQSEDMRRIYINEYIKAGERNGLVMNREELENKFLGLGSPKFDRVARIRREDIDVPEAWLRIIEKPDGTRKKVIFYNTSVSAMLHAQDKMIQKIKKVFVTFRENGEEVALLWRPHPLMKDTIRAMLPELWEEYEAIVQEYRKEGWGIYDDTPDLDRAIALSDAYYGDASSVVQLCQKAGLPVMIQNVNV